MKRIRIFQADAFTRQAFGGNPAGVVPDAEGLSDDEMLKIAREMNCSETAFVLIPSAGGEADLRVRYFTPAGEVDLCGHATVATFRVLAGQGKLDGSNEENPVWIETKAGILPVRIVHDQDGGDLRVIMDQMAPVFQGPFGDVRELSAILGLAPEDLAFQGLEPEIVSTGLPDLLIPVRSLEALRRAAPDFRRMAAYQKENGIISFHLYTFETEDAAADLQVRDFAPSVDIDEESATGTANCALAALLVRRGAVRERDGLVTLKMGQGHGMGRPSLIETFVLVEDGRIAAVRAGGSAVVVLEGEMVF